MKAKLLFLFLLVGNVYVSNAQDEISVKIGDGISCTLKQGVYMLDSAAIYKRVYKYPVDSKQCYFQINGDYAVMYYVLRGRQHYYLGDIINKRVVDVEGTPVNAFTIDFSGTRMFVGVSYEKANPKVYELDVYGIPTTVLSSHMASAAEEKSLRSGK